MSVNGETPLWVGSSGFRARAEIVFSSRFSELTIKEQERETKSLCAVTNYPITIQVSETRLFIECRSGAPER